MNNFLKAKKTTKTKKMKSPKKTKKAVVVNTKVIRTEIAKKKMSLTWKLIKERKLCKEYR